MSSKPSPSAEVRLDLAGQVVRVVGATAAARAWARERYRPFLTTKPAAFTLRVRGAGRWPAGRPPGPRAEQHDSRFRIVASACRIEGDLVRRTAVVTAPPGPAALSPSLLRTLCSLLLVGEGGFLLHASSVVHERRAWVFCGPSESGKTTLARLASPRPVLNDETIAILRRPRGYAAAATPFFGEGGPVMAQRNATAPLRAAFFLHRGAGFTHRRLTPREVVERAWRQVFLPKRDPRIADALLGAVTDFALTTPCYDLAFVPTREVWDYLDAIA